MTKWIVEYLTSKPTEFQLIGPNMYMQRRNIESVIDDQYGGMHWQCESREITAEEYDNIAYIDAEEVVTNIMNELNGTINADSIYAELKEAFYVQNS